MGKQENFLFLPNINKEIGIAHKSSVLPHPTPPPNTHTHTHTHILTYRVIYTHTHTHTYLHTHTGSPCGFNLGCKEKLNCPHFPASHSDSFFLCGPNYIPKLARRACTQANTRSNGPSLTDCEQCFPALGMRGGRGGRGVCLYAVKIWETDLDSPWVFIVEKNNIQ